MLIKVASSVLAGEGNVIIACLNMQQGVSLLDRLQRMFETQPGLKITRKIDRLDVNGTIIRAISPASPDPSAEFGRPRGITDHSVYDSWRASSKEARKAATDDEL